MIVITGATGNVGRHVINELAERGAPVTAVTRDPRRLEVPGVTVTAGDLTDPPSLAPAFRSAERLFLLVTAGGPANPVDVPSVLEQASAAGMRHVVMVSTMLSETHPDSFPGQRGIEAETLVKNSGLEWTILRPWELASNTFAWIPELRRGGVVRSPTAGVASPVVHPADIAAVAIAALSNDDHLAATYALTGPAAIDPNEKVAAISDASGSDYRFEVVDDAEWRERIIDQSPDPTAAQLAIAGVCGLDSGRITDTTVEILGRPARNFQAWATENAAAFA